MKRPLILLVVLVAAAGAAAWWLQRARVGSPVLLPPPPVPLQDRTTIDFSSGRPVVKDSAAERELIDAAMKDITAAARHIKFAPITAPKPEPDLPKSNP